MRLSEAIRLGAGEGPQSYTSLESKGRRKYFMFGPRVTEYCALGAAFKAVNAPVVEETVTTSDAAKPFRGSDTTAVGEVARIVRHPWHGLMWHVVGCPQCGRREAIYRLIPHMNDDHRMKREQIADFIEPIEIEIEQQRERERVEWERSYAESQIEVVVAESDEPAIRTPDQFVRDLQAEFSTPQVIHET